MRTPLSALLVALALAVPSPAAPPAPPPSAAPAAQELPDLHDELDGCVRWLRSKQDPLTGAYGAGVGSTALVLRALAVAPRHYRRSDGPFVARALDYLAEHQDDAGWIADPDAGSAERLAQTREAARALFRYVDADSTAMLSKAVAWLGAQGVEDPAGGDEGFATDKQAAARRGPDGGWEGEGGAVEASARAVIELSFYEALLKTPKVVPEGAKPLPALAAADAQAVDASILRGARFLIGASEDGKWGAPGQPDAGITAMVLGALQAVPEPRPEDVQRVVDGGLAWLVSLQREDGSIQQGRLANYVTSASILALARDGRHPEVVQRARDFLLELQADEGEGYSEDHPFYGGVGYGDDERPDLSNLQMALEAMVASGLDQDNEAFQRALRFLERCQNRSESNDIEFRDGDTVIVSGNDGGASYYPGDSKAGFEVLEDGRKVPRSYGSMTYALLKGYVFAGLDKEDPRVKACWKWLQEHYTLDVNPGFEASSDPTAPYQGLFYYFHSMARALAVYGQDVIVDGAGKEHAWRVELAGRLIAMQSKIDGSWVNENAPRWWEGNPVLATAYALRCLDETR